MELLIKGYKGMYYPMLSDPNKDILTVQPESIAYCLNIDFSEYTHLLESSGARLKNNYIFTFYNIDKIKTFIEKLEPYIMMRKLE